MIKTIALLKRRPGMTVAEFREHYETHHRRIGEKYLSGIASRYVRRYLTPAPGRGGDDDADAAFDVVMEIWYPDRAAQQAASQVLAATEAQREIIEDEERLFDRPRNRFFLLEEEQESDLPELR